jgi:hypothetical protein
MIYMTSDDELTESAKNIFPLELVDTVIILYLL